MAGTAGRALRAAVGVALVVAGLLIGGGAGIVIAIIGLLPIAAGVFGFCLLGPLFGVGFTYAPPSGPTSTAH